MPSANSLRCSWVVVSQDHQARDNVLPFHGLHVFVGDFEEVGVEVVDIPETPRVEDEVDRLYNPIEGYHPEKESCRSGHSSID